VKKYLHYLSIFDYKIMAIRTRIFFSEPQELHTVKEANAQIADHKLVVILFNVG
jgi:hypothetical protein